jgi:hypothetical protein
MSAVVKGTKFRAFQYKILFNLIPCNLYLNRIKRCDTNKCARCQELDDLAHYLYQCAETRIFWNSFTNWWNNKTNDKIKLSEKDVMVGVLDEKGRYDTLNACIILAKWHIYKNKLNESAIFLYKFLCDLKYYLIIEKTIAIRNQRTTQYNQRWENIEED